MTTNMLTFDIEEWFHANYDGLVADPSKGSSFPAHMDTLLNMCQQFDCKATFFTLGVIGEKYPDIVKRIVREGHDLASHGYSHELAYKQSVSVFTEDVRKSIHILEQLTGQKVLGYRAPSWSIVERNYHYLEALESLGLKYDASIFPVRTFLYGIPDAPRHIHKPIVNGRELDLFEVPMSVMQLGNRTMGYSGGFYFRFFPHFLIDSAIRRANKRGDQTLVYLHPREIDPHEHKLNLPAKESFIHYYNVAGTKQKLARIMQSFTFTSVADGLRKQHGLR